MKDLNIEHLESCEDSHITQEIEKYEEGYSINGCCGGGCYIISNIRYCPFCSVRLNITEETLKENEYSESIMKEQQRVLEEYQKVKKLIFKTLSLDDTNSLYRNLQFINETIGDNYQ